MYKKILSVSFFLLSSTATLADSAHLNGFYFGAQAGGSESTFNTHQVFDVNLATQTHVTLPNNHKLADTSGLIGLNAGLSYLFCNQFYTAVEARANAERFRVSQKGIVNEFISGFHIAGQTQLEERNEFSLVAKPGFLMTRCSLLYGLIGASWSKFSRNTNSNFSNPIVDNGALLATMRADTGFNASTHKSALLLGLGMEQFLSQNLSLKLEYTHARYANAYANASSTGTLGMSPPLFLVPDGSLLTANNKSDATNNAVSLGLTYHL